MGSIILCHKKKARRPYEISQVQRRIYTIEELCFYLSSHLYLIDQTIVNDRLCAWLEEELDMQDLAAQLRQILEQNGSAEQFAVAILAHSAIYTTADLGQIQTALNALKNQKPIERQKYKADNLLESGAVGQAIRIYQSIVCGEPDERVDKKFYGRVYACLGSAYGRLFLYKEAAKMYEAAFQICEEPAMQKAYVYACRRMMSEEEYERFLEKSQAYREVEDSLRGEIEQIEQNVCFVPEADTLEQWKEQYRRMGASQ